jgi:hypothetical protein
VYWHRDGDQNIGETGLAMLFGEPERLDAGTLEMLCTESGARPTKCAKSLRTTQLPAQIAVDRAC